MPLQFFSLQPSRIRSREDRERRGTTHLEEAPVTESNHHDYFEWGSLPVLQMWSHCQAVFRLEEGVRKLAEEMFVVLPSLWLHLLLWLELEHRVR